MHLGNNRGSCGLHFGITEADMIVVFEGIDGSGKTSIIDDLMLYLPSHLTTSRSAEPYHMPLFALSPDPVTATLQLAQARWRHCWRVAALSADWQNNHIHLIDRFDLSTIAYQGYGDGVSLSFINTLNRYVTQPLTDVAEPLYIYLDVPVDVAVRRVQERGEVMSDTEIQRLERVRAGYLEVCESEKGHGDLLIYPTVIDANRPFGQVFTDVLECITGGNQ